MNPGPVDNNDYVKLPYTFVYNINAISTCVSGAFVHTRRIVIRQLPV